MSWIESATLMVSAFEEGVGKEAGYGRELDFTVAENVWKDDCISRDDLEMWKCLLHSDAVLGLLSRSADILQFQNCVILKTNAVFNSRYFSWHEGKSAILIGFIDSWLFLQRKAGKLRSRAFPVFFIFLATKCQCLLEKNTQHIAELDLVDYSLIEIILLYG